MKVKNSGKFFNLKDGFTLIELLIVIAIVGILSTLVIVNLINVRERARDAQRKSDLRQMQSALELYRADQGSYVVDSSAPYKLISPCVSGSSLKSPDCSSTYMQSVPQDPLGNSTFNGGDYYYYSDGSTYYLIACLENTSDSQGIKNLPGNLPAGSSACSTSFYYVTQNP